MKTARRWRTARRWLRTAWLATLGALAAVVVLWLAGPQGRGHRLPEMPSEVWLDAAPSLALSPDGAFLEQQRALLERLEDTQITLDLRQVAPEQALQAWADAAGVQLVISGGVETLRDDFGHDARVSFSCEGEPAGAALDRLLEVVGLPPNWFLRDGMVVIAHWLMDDDRHFLRIYDVRDLMLQASSLSARFGDPPKVDDRWPPAPTAGTEAQAADGLIEFLKDRIEATNIGNYSNPQFSYWGGRLGVYATPREHIRVRRLLAELRAPEGRE